MAPMPPLPPLNELCYCMYDGKPALWRWDEAWCLENGKWVPKDPADLGHEALVIGKAAFKRNWRRLPPLPESIFKDPE